MMHYRTTLLYLTVLTLLACIPGCGGGSGSSGLNPPGNTQPGDATATSTDSRDPTALITVAVNWAPRSRAVTAQQASALSAVLTLKGANPDGKDFSFTVNRDPAKAASYTDNYTSPTPAVVGTWPLSVQLFALQNGVGAGVGGINTTVTIKLDGSGIDMIATTGTVATVAVTGGQRVQPGEHKNLEFVARDASGSILPLLPNAAFFNVVNGGDKLRITNGQVEGVSTGSATVTATVDGKVSSPASVTVTYLLTDLSDTYIEGSTPYYIEATPIRNKTINSSGQIIGSISTNGRRHTFLWQSNGQQTELNPLPGGTSSLAIAINNHGLVVGSSDIGGKTHAVVWQNGTITDLGTLGGNNSSAYAVNNSGAVVGNAETREGNSHAVLWQNGQIVDLVSLAVSAGSPPPPGTTYASIAYAINDSGWVVGWVVGSGSAANGDLHHAVLWRNSQMIYLGTLPANVVSSSATQINKAGQVVGSYDDTNHSTHYFFWQNGQITDLGSITPIAINDSGAIIGSTGDTHAVLWQNGQTTDLGMLTNSNGYSNYTTAWDINNNGQVVGNSNGRAFLWQNGQMTDLNNLIPGSRFSFLPSRVMNNAYSIGDNGLIVGFANRSSWNGHSGTVLLTPK